MFIISKASTPGLDVKYTLAPNVVGAAVAVANANEVAVANTNQAAVEEANRVADSMITSPRRRKRKAQDPPPAAPPSKQQITLLTDNDLGIRPPLERDVRFLYGKRQDIKSCCWREVSFGELLTASRFTNFIWTRDTLDPYDHSKTMREGFACWKRCNREDRGTVLFGLRNDGLGRVESIFLDALIKLDDNGGTCGSFFVNELGSNYLCHEDEKYFYRDFRRDRPRRFYMKRDRCDYGMQAVAGLMREANPELYECKVMDIIDSFANRKPPKRGTLWSDYDMLFHD